MFKLTGGARGKAAASAPRGSSAFVRAAAPTSNGTWTTPSMRVLGQVPAPVLGSSDITALFAAHYGEVKAGQKVFVAVKQVIDGHESIPPPSGL